MVQTVGREQLNEPQLRTQKRDEIQETPYYEGVSYCLDQTVRPKGFEPLTF